MPNNAKEWKALTEHAASMRDAHMRDLFGKDPARFEKFHLKLGGLLLDYSRHRVTEETRAKFLALAKAAGVEDWRNKMFSGEKVNATENRPALHVALRGSTDKSLKIDGETVSEFVDATLKRVKEISDKIRADQSITDVISIGIGGSDLGARVVYETLQEFHDGPRTTFVSNIDGARISGVLKNLKPANTAFIIVSKTFSTMETLTNATTAKKWAGSAKNFYAVTSNEKAATDFGIAKDHILPMRDWIGGRMSLWSAAGLPVAVSLGFENFKKLLDGARTMDEHFKTAPLDQNIPVIMAMLGVWYRNFMGFGSHVMLPYAHALRKFPAYIQQLDMESNGKTISRNGKPVDYKTGAVVFGETGTNAQHAFMQMMHQGTDISPIDFVIVKTMDHPLDDHHRKLNANALAQAQTLMHGVVKPASPHQTFEGNRPSSTLVIEKLDPWHLGLLLALYEHKIFVQGIVWNINSFDQWGVELGKTLANNILGPNAETSADQTTKALMKLLGS